MLYKVLEYDDEVRRLQLLCVILQYLSCVIKRMIENDKLDLFLKSCLYGVAYK